MRSSVLLDRAGRRRSAASLPGYDQGRAPRNKGLRYPPDPPTVEEVIAVMRAGGENVDGLGLRGLIVVLWRAGLRISEALALAEVILTRRGGRSWCGAGKVASAARSGWTAGPGNNSRPGSPSAPRSRSAPCSASCEDRPAGASARQPPSACSYATQPKGLASGDGSPPTNSVTHTPSRCHAKACPCSSSNANSDTPTYRSPRCTCAESTTRRSSTPSTSAPPR